jgi:hypothetical protein
MLTLYSYPNLFGVADNNPFGLKVYAFLKLCGLAFRHEHIFDASKAPRGQLPYLVDGDLAAQLHRQHDVLRLIAVLLRQERTKRPDFTDKQTDGEHGALNAAKWGTNAPMPLPST